jgi:adenine/guanine/hypoxanthine permease
MTNDRNRPNLLTEVFAGLSTFLTLSYVLVLNPILLSQAGIDISAAFFATVISSALATLAMGLWAKLPFAIAPAPSITTFFVSYVCLTLGLPWQAALAAVILSGFLSWAMAALAVRQRLIESIPAGLKIGILFALAGFLFANGLTQAKLIGFTNGWIDLAKANPNLGATLTLLTGLSIAVISRLPWLRFSGAPLLGILVATAVAAYFGILGHTDAHLGPEMLSAVGQADFTLLFDWRMLTSMFVFFIIDFFGGVGKFIGLFAAIEDEELKAKSERQLGRALYVDGAGNILGGLLGASSLAVFISSAVGIKAGGKTGWTAVTVAALMAISLFAIPLVGSIPVEAISGILVFVGFILIPWPKIWRGELGLRWSDYLVFALAGLFGFLTFGLDKALLLLFAYYSFERLRAGFRRDEVLLYVVTLFLGAAVLSDMFLR